VEPPRLTATGRLEQGRPVPLRTTVRRISELTPRLRRLVLGGGDLGHFRWTGAASQLKVIVPGPGQSVAVLPPAGALQPVRLERATMTLRTYTPRAWDAAAGELVLDMLVHGEGPGSEWARQARPGTELAVTSALGRYDVDARADWLVLAGDESALPAIATILEVTPAGLPTTVVAEVAGDEDRIDLGAGPAVTVSWPRRAGAPGAALREALARLDQAGDGRVWVGCEAHAMLDIRRHLLEVRHLPRASVTVRGYWTAGRAAPA
jgi:NADPH-dependent ferric siderophore reductase